MRALIGFGTLQLFNTAFVLSLTIYQMFELDVGLTTICSALCYWVGSYVLRCETAFSPCSDTSQTARSVE